MSTLHSFRSTKDHYLVLILQLLLEPASLTTQSDFSEPSPIQKNISQYQL